MIQISISDLDPGLRYYARVHKRLPTRIVCNPFSCSKVWLALKRTWGNFTVSPVEITGDLNASRQFVTLE